MTFEQENINTVQSSIPSSNLNVITLEKSLVSDLANTTNYQKAFLIMHIQQFCQKTLLI